jgi:hypothetical protein
MNKTNVMKIELNPHSVDKNITLKVIEYSLKTEKVFLNTMLKDMKLNTEEAAFVSNHMIALNNATGPNHILTKAHPNVGFNPDVSQLHLLPSALFSYVDHLEIIEARKAAKEARILSWIAIGITLFLGVLQIYFQINSN